jgi:hypothetical protein
MTTRDMSALYREDATLEETVTAYQFLIDTGDAWRMDGFTGRTAMRLIEDGLCTLGPNRVKDYYGNTVPAITDVEPGTKGSTEYAAQRRDWG